jgi:ABC-2 type transport system ATP-binding protein
MNALTIRNLRKTYANGNEALKGINFNVAVGDFYALLGPNGAGKTTAIGIISSLVNKTAGEVEVFGHSIDRELEAAKQCIGLVPQELNINQWEKVGNIVLTQAGYYGLGGRLARERAEKYLRALRLWDRRDDIARSLSGGMKRRLMIARALVHEPKLLILDEPTAGVDIEIRRSMWSFLREINAIIDEGEIIEDAPMSRVLRKLQREVFVLSLADEPGRAPVLDGFRTELVNSGELEVEMGPSHTLNDLFHALDAKGIEVVSLRNKANRLEELFMRLVESKQP